MVDTRLRSHQGYEMLTVVGGSYIENCVDPSYNELFGSGLRGAIAVSGFDIKIQFFTIIGEDLIHNLKEYCLAYNIDMFETKISNSFTFFYYHPLSQSYYYPEVGELQKISIGKLDKVLMYGLLEGDFEFVAEKVVYDPQNGRLFSSTGSSAKILAYVLNRKEAIELTNSEKDCKIEDLIFKLVELEEATVIIIKDSVFGAYLWDGIDVTHINFYKTERVWPIGSGDVFSAAFAYYWLIKEEEVKNSANMASLLTAGYCNSKVLPLVEKAEKFPISLPKTKNIYLAGPFFSLSDRWIVNEALQAFSSFRQQVFSPFHTLGICDDTEAAKKDLDAINSCDLVFAILNNLDPGTLFEIGYARSLNKEVIIYSETISERDLFMLNGSDCKIFDDFSTAIYLAST